MLAFRLFHVPEFPTDLVQPRYGRGEPEITPWLLNLRADILVHGFRQPLIVYGHHETRGQHQPLWMVKIGYNRLWCAKSLGLPTIPVICSAHKPPPFPHHEIHPAELQLFLTEGTAWVDETGFGVTGVRLPQEEFK